jgi:hypothetical protein
MPEAIETSSTSYRALLTGSMAASPIGTVAAPSADPSPTSLSGAPVWTAYEILCRRSGRGYVGITRRSLPVRVAAHDLLARRRPDLGGPGSLGAAIRRAHGLGLSFHEAFSVRVLAQTSDPQQARELERLWIARLGTAAPHGYNLMPGGASLGGPANAEAVSIRHRQRGLLHFGSLMDAVADINREREQGGKAPLSLGGVYARRALGWTIEEALELRRHADGRRQRALFRWHGRTYHSLHELARKEGLPISTARSRLHRARRAGCDSSHDGGTDRRKPGPWRRDGTGCGLQPPPPSRG